MSFIKRGEVFEPCDMTWLQVNVDVVKKSVSIQHEDNVIIICEGDGQQLSELIAILRHIRNTHFPDCAF